MAVTAVAFLIAYHFVSPQGHGAAIAPFDFVWSYVQRRRYRALYLPLSLAWLAAAICVGLVARKVLSNGVRRSLRDTHLIELELIVVTMIASLGPGLLLRIAGGSAFYFIDVQRWVSVLFLIPFAIEYLSMLTPRSFVFGRPFELRRTLAWLVLGLTVVASIGVMIANTAHRLRIVADTVLSDRSGASFGSWEALIQLPRIGGEGRPEDQRRLQLLDTFRAIQRLPSLEKQRTVLYIPKTNRAYWDFFSVTAAPPLRKAVPFLAQAVAGVAMIDGLPDPDPEVAWTAYGYEAYALPREPQVRSSLEQSRDDVLRKAQRAGFARVIVVQENSDGTGIKEWCIETAIPCGLLRAEG